jgi:hypothetical protein
MHYCLSLNTDSHLIETGRQLYLRSFFCLLQFDQSDCMSSPQKSNSSPVMYVAL